MLLLSLDLRLITGLCILISRGFGIFLVLVLVVKLEDACLIYLVGFG